MNINDVKNVDLNYKQVWIDSKDNNKIDFDIVVEVDADVNAYNRKLKEQCIHSIRLLVLVKCGGDLSIKLKDFRIYGVEDYVMSKPEKPMSGDMVPIIFRNEYEKYGEEILKKYYPEGLVSNKPIDIKKLVTNMGLQVFKTKITKNQSVFGQRYFEDTKTWIYSWISNQWDNINIPKDTIIIDVDDLQKVNETINEVIVHECIHYALHKSTFLFNQLFYENLYILECENNGKIKGIDNNANIMWMEE